MKFADLYPNWSSLAGLVMVAASQVDLKPIFILVEGRLIDVLLSPTIKRFFVPRMASWNYSKVPLSYPHTFIPLFGTRIETRFFSEVFFMKPIKFYW